MPRAIFKPIKVAKELNWLPYQPKKKIIKFRTPGDPKPFVRPPAIYQNKSREELINQYLEMDV